MNNSYGVVIGRFQPFHEGHKALIYEVLNTHERVVIVVGESPLAFSTRSPIPVSMVQDTIADAFPAYQHRIEFSSLEDQPTNELWSYNLDRLIHSYTGSRKAVLYGSRDSFIPAYKGKYPTTYIDVNSGISSTQIRDEKAINFISADTPVADALMWVAGRQYPAVIPTVDVAVFNEQNQLLMIRKANETKWRLPGGFADPKSSCFEQDAGRELREECGDLDIGGWALGMHYVGSYKIDDWRYRSEKSKIITTLFYAQSQFGTPKAGDDASEVKWHKLGIPLSTVVPEHHTLVVEAVAYHRKQGKK